LCGSAKARKEREVRSHLRSRRLAVVAAAAVAVLAAGGVSYAMIPSSGGVFTACVNKAGKMRLIDPDAGATCRGNERQVTWNQTGPSGPAGAMGATGATGLKGDQGATGNPGQTGATGATGGTGATGAPGAPATPGQSGTPAGQVMLSAGATPFSVRSFQFGAGVGVSNTDPPVIGNPSFSEFTFTKGYDSNSVVLLNDLATKTVLPKVVLKATWDSGATLTYELTNAIVSGDSVSSNDGDQPSESFSLHFASVKWTFTDASGTSSGSST
jgi:hypothetical protein